jgi:HSP20 family protein
MPRYEQQPSPPARELRAFLDLLDPDAAGDCNAPMDVIETTAGVEIVVDLPGVRPESLSVVFARDTIVITARKIPSGCEQGETAFHLAERGFGLCSRTIRLEGAFDVGRADATLAAGELRIILPRIDERRGREIRIPVRAS